MHLLTGTPYRVSPLAKARSTGEQSGKKAKASSFLITGKDAINTGKQVKGKNKSNGTSAKKSNSCEGKYPNSKTCVAKGKTELR